MLRDPILTIRRMYDRYGPLVAYSLDLPFVPKGQHFILAVGPPYNERVLGDTATFGAGGGLMPPGPASSAHNRIRSGVVTMNGSKHQYYRRLLAAPFRRSAIDHMVGTIGETVQHAIHAWQCGEVTDLWPLAKGIAQTVALTSLFGTKGSSDFAEALTVADLVSDHVRMAWAPQVRGCPIDLPGLPYRRMLRHAERVEMHLSSWVKKRRGELRSDDLLSLVANSPDETGMHLSDEQVASHLLTLLGASFETCQTALTWTLFLLAQHPEASMALLDELSALPGSGDVSAAHLAQCTWLDAVVKESMRLLPPVPFQVRKALRNTDLIDCKIGRDTRVILSPFLTNRLPELYPDGDRFKPERWSRIEPSQYEYLVFSAGPRMCIGYWFAMTFLKIAIAQIVRTYRLRIVPRARIDCRVAISMWPSRGIPVIIHRQDRRFSASPVTGNICELIQ
jgi:cytochrome P450